MKQEIIDLARNALAGSIPMLVLRGVDEQARSGGDIDILVPSRQAKRACGLLAEAANSAGWFLAFFRDIGYLAQVVLIRPGQECADEAIKVDFFAGFEWYGVGSDVVGRRFFEIAKDAKGAADQEVRLSSVVNYLQKCLTCGRLNDRDWQRVVTGMGSASSLLGLTLALGMPITANDIAMRGVAGQRQWRLRAASAGIEGLFGMALWFLRVALAHLQFKLGMGTGAGHLFGLSGLDGSGKSTQMERIFSAYQLAGGEQPRLVHLLPTWIPMPHQLVRRKKTEQNYMRPYSEAPVRSRWSGFLRIGYYLVAFFVAKFWMRLLTARGRVLVLDRSFADFAADLTRSRIPDFQLPAWLIKLCAPKGTLLFLDALPGTVVKRKGELELGKATDLRQRYLKIFEYCGGEVIDAEGSPDKVFSCLLEQIDIVYRQRLMSVLLR